MAKKKWIAFMMGLALSCASVSIMSACGGNESNSSAPSSSESSMEAPVTIEYKVKFNSLGGSEVEAQTVEKGKKATKPADPTREGYTFVEWQLNGNTYTFEGAVMGDITLTAKWQKNEAKKFTVTFVADGETFHTAEAVDGKQVLAPTSLPTRDGYVFDCWALDDVAYDFETPVTAELTLTAKWVKTWTVTFDAGEGVTVDPVVVKEGETVSAPEVSKKGYELSDWLLGDESYDFATPITADITLTAVWTEKEGEEEPTFEMSFVQGSADTIKVGETTTLTVETNVTGEIEWISSDEAVATVANGVVTGVSKGEVTITAKLGELSASKTIYVEEVVVPKNQIGIRINGWNMTSSADYFNMVTGANGEKIITAKFQANETYSPALIVTNLADKADYEQLIADGYVKLTFNLAVDGDVSDLYVFGKKLTTFAKSSDGVYAIVVDLQVFVTYYDTMSTIATSPNQVGQASSASAKFITWKSPAGDWSTARNYTFTISNATLRKGALFSNNVGMRINGWDMSTNTSYMTMETGKDGEMVVGAKFQANETYAPALVLKNLKDKSYYETLIANGYTKLTFNLAVEGDVSDLYVFGKALNTFSQNDGVYTVVIDVQHIVNHYDTISTIATSGSQVGQATSMAAKLITWKSPAGDWSTTRNYVFTISNSAFVKAE